MSIFDNFTVRAARPLPVLVLADASGSMRDDNKIGILNRSLREMVGAFARQDDIAGEIHVAVIAFSGADAWLHTPLTPATAAQIDELQADGKTPIGRAFDLATSILEDTDQVPHRAYQPTIVLVSDGRPTDEGWQEALERLLSSGRGSRAMRVAVGIGTELDDEAQRVLRTFVGDDGAGLVQADDVEIIAKFFRWVTMSVTSRLTSATPDVVPTLTIDDLDY